MDEYSRAVFEIQDNIRNISQVNEKIPNLNPDGIYGDETRFAVLTFQNEYGLPPDGKVDFETWQALEREGIRARFELSDPIQTAPVRSDELPFERGDIDDRIYTVKLKLAKVAERFNNFSRPTTFNNEFDEETEQQIRLWQRVISVPETGKVDKTTWNSISEFYLLREEFF